MYCIHAHNKCVTLINLMLVFLSITRVISVILMTALYWPNSKRTNRILRVSIVVISQQRIGEM
jgi:hypothetical protein